MHVRQNDSTEDRFPSTYTNSYPCGGANSREFFYSFTRVGADSTWFLLRGVFYSGFGAGQGTHKSTDRAAEYVKNDGESRRPCCDGRGRSATGSRTLREDGGRAPGTTKTKRRTYESHKRAAGIGSDGAPAW